MPQPAPARPDRGTQAVTGFDRGIDPAGLDRTGLGRGGRGLARVRVGRRAVLGTVAVGAVGMVAGCDGDPAPAASTPPQTVTVTRGDLVDFTDVEGEFGFGEAVPLRYVRPAADGEAPADGAGGGGLGLVTWLAPVGSTVVRGKPLLRVDDQPVVLLYGALPAYRTLITGCRGGDVRQLEANLRALRMGDLTVDTAFTAATGAAVKRWQRSLGLADTGTVEPQRVVYAPGPVRIAAHALRVGDPADGEVLSHTGATRSVTLRLTEQRRQLAVPGTAVTVRLAAGAEVPGTVDRVGLPAESDGGEPAIEVYVLVADQSAVDGAAGRVTVRFTAQRRDGVLTVPVTALVALAEGGYGVQVAEGGTTRYVAVRTGLFAGGRVEVTAGELAAGVQVVVPR
ncbi:peptidoglycan-binding protein [Catellatospora citrea]|uniref:Peptidoglycan-binding protein n=1 Tax=Catellatospora citrea TaxID=53366 RepID=A0A8J3NZD7_9ACTN|nr:peptidoglycan-binding protein [Catellatospora citrea]